MGVGPLDTGGKTKDNLMRDNKSGKGSVQIQRFLPNSWLPLEIRGGKTLVNYENSGKTEL